MQDLDDSLAEARAAVDAMIQTVSHAATQWAAPPAPGRWSPSQVVEHVALALEASADDIAGRPSRFPNLPRPIRFLARTFFFDRVLRTGAFPKGKTNPAMNPASGPPTPAAGVARLEAAWECLSATCVTAAAQNHQMTSTIFGRVGLVDYIRFQTQHTWHHHRQLTRS
jgi:hypothetical protein